MMPSGPSRHPSRLHALTKHVSEVRDIEELVERSSAAGGGGGGGDGGGGCACDSSGHSSCSSSDQHASQRAATAAHFLSDATQRRLERSARTAAAARVENLLAPPPPSVTTARGGVRAATAAAASSAVPLEELGGAAGPGSGAAATHPLGGLRAVINTADEYVASLRGRGLIVYLFGELIEEPADHPIIVPSVNAVAETYRLGEEVPELGTALGLSGVRCNRFLHVTESAADVVLQSKMQRTLGQRTGTCFQRCVGMDAINSCFSITYDIDAKHGTRYHQQFRDFIGMMQRQNYVLGGAMTDPKGDRSKGPTGQTDPDLFVRVVERRVDGLVIRGAKMHQTGCINAHWLLTMPGGRMASGDEDYASICALPVDSPGLSFIYGRQSCDTRAIEVDGTDIDQGNAKFGGQEATIIFDDVFVPYEHVFMNGEVEFAQELVERFTSYHRRSYICKAGLGDVLIGAAATISDFNGISKASHVKDKLVEMAYLNENIAGTALAASHMSRSTAAGNYQPDVLMANVCKHNVTRLPYDLARIAQDLAGGLMSTLPSDADFRHEVAGPLLYKYLQTAPGATVDNRRRILRLIENMTMGRNAVGYLVESTHGAGSPQAQRVLIARLMDVESKKQMAKHLAGIEDDGGAGAAA